MNPSGTQAPERVAEAKARRGLGPRVWLVLFVALAAFGLRAWRLGSQSLWVDEGISVLTSIRTPGELLATVISGDLHPPLYYLALHYWIALVGSSEYAVRFLSAAFGFLAIPAMYQMTRCLLLVGRSPRLGAAPLWGGGLAALLAALSPFLVYYSQEARNYMMVTVLGILASLALWKGQEAILTDSGRGNKVRWWLAYIFLAALVLYTNYFGALLLLAHALYLGIVSLRHRRFPVMGAMALVATTLLYLPWVKPGLIQMLRIQSTPDFWAGSLSLQTLMERLFVAFSLGPKAQASTPALIAFAFILVLGLVSLVRIKETPIGRGELFLVLYLIVPLVIVYAITARAPKFTERYLIMAAPAFYLLVARGLAFLLLHGRALLSGGKRHGYLFLGVFAVGTLAVLTPSTVFTYQILKSPDFIRDNNRAAVAYIEANSKPGDVIVLMMNAPQAFQYYYKGDLPWYGIQPGDDFRLAAADLNRVTQGKERLWLYLWNPDWADPAAFVLDSLDDAAPRVFPDKYFPGIEVRAYSLTGKPHFSADFKPKYPVNANFEGKVQLLGYDAPASPIPSDSEGTVTLYWTALQQLTEEYVVSLRLKKDGHYWGNREVRPTNYFYPTTSWQPGAPVRGRVSITPLPGTPPGQYEVEVAFHSVGPSGQGRDLPILGSGGAPQGTSVIVGTLEVGSALKDPSALDLGLTDTSGTPLSRDIVLLGAQTAARAVRPGDVVPLTLFLKASSRPQESQRIVISLEDSLKKVMTLYDFIPAHGAYPTNKWRPGEVIRDQYSLSVPVEAAPGPATIQVTLAGTEQVETAPSVVARLDIQERVRTMTRPAGIQHVVEANLDNAVVLVGYDLSSNVTRPGGTLRLVLYWQALQESRAAYTVFTHLLGNEDRIRAQQDNPPMRGKYPTNAWARGEYVRDEYDLTVDPAAPPGEYVLEAGMYDGATGKRLSLLSDGKPVDNRIILGKVRVGP